jgi:hypothetical protein
VSGPLGSIHGNGRPHPRPPGVESDTGQGAPETAPPPDQPGLKLEIAEVRAVKHQAVPTITFSLDISDDSGREVFMAGLSIQIQIEPAKRIYDAESKKKLEELFGDPHRWTTTAQRMLWTLESVLIPTFTGKTTIDVPVLCNYDVELAAAKYFYSVSDGEIPLAFHFNGSIYYAGDEGRLQVVQVPWDTVADFKMPISIWREMMDSYYPYRGWVPVHRDTLDALQRLKAQRGAPTFDAAISELLAEKTLTGEAPSPEMDLPPGMPQPGSPPPMGGDDG